MKNMYSPYLRAKREELLALIELPQNVFQSEKVLPILEPTNLNQRTVGYLSRILEQDKSFVLIVNSPINGAPTLDVIQNQLFGEESSINNFDRLLLGFIVSEDINIQEFRAFQDLECRKILIHCSNHDREIWNAGEFNDIEMHVFISGEVTEQYWNEPQFDGVRKVVIADGFIRRSRNVDYPDTSEFDSSFFFADDSVEGFGDFQMVGHAFSGGRGGPAFSIAIHLPVLEQNRVVMRHFHSTDEGGADNRGGKVVEAIELATMFLTNNRNQQTLGSTQIMDLIQNEPPTSPAMLKRKSLMHHIELMSRLINRTD